MQEVGAFEAKNTLGALLDRVEQGEEIVITRHGKPVANLVAHASRIDPARQAAVRETMARIRARASGSGMKLFDWETLKAERDEGRP
jgi:prevent-host-death family protein